MTADTNIETNKKEKIVPVRKLNRKSAYRLFFNCVFTFLLFEFIYKLVFRLVLKPLGSMAFGFVLSLSPEQYIINSNMVDMLKCPWVILMILILAAGLFYWNLIEIISIIICLKHAKAGEKITLIQLFREAFRSSVRAFRPGNLPILLYAGVLMPFINFGTMYNFMNELTIPEYIMEVINDSWLLYLIYFGVALIGVVIIIGGLFIFHYFVIEEKTFRESYRSSLALIRKRKFKSVMYLIVWQLQITLVLVLVAIIMTAGYILLSKYLTVNSLYYQVSLTTVVEVLVAPAAAVLFNGLAVLLFYSYISVLFWEFSDEGAEIHRKDIYHLIKTGNRRHRNVSCIVIAFVFAVSVLFVPLCTFMADKGVLLDLIVPNPTTITSHRGYSAVAPENTLPAFQAAIDTDVVTYAELDVQETKDGAVVLTHDTNLKRCTGVDKNVYELTLAEIKKLDASACMPEKKFKGTKIPTLAEVIELVDGKIMLNIEIKNNGHCPTLEQDVVDLIHEYDFVDQCVVTSLSYDSLKKVKAADPAIKTGLILNLGVGSFYDLPDIDFFSMETTFVNRNVVRQLHNRNKEVHVWTVDQEDDALKMLNMGVDSIITGQPELIYKNVQAVDLSYFYMISPTLDDKVLRKHFSEETMQQFEVLLSKARKDNNN